MSISATQTSNNSNEKHLLMRSLIRQRTTIVRIKVDETNEKWNSGDLKKQTSFSSLLCKVQRKKKEENKEWAIEQTNIHD